MAREQLRGRDWLSFSLAAALPGLTLAILLSGVFQYAGDEMALDKSQVAMWLVPPLWLAAAGLAFAAPTPAAAWWRLLLGNAAALCAFLAFRFVL